MNKKQKNLTNKGFSLVELIIRHLLNAFNPLILLGFCCFIYINFSPVVV